MTLLQTYLIGMIGFTGGLSLAMSGTSNIRVSAVSPPRLQKVTWSAVTCGGKSVMLSIFTIPVFYTPNTRQAPSDCYRFPTPPPPPPPPASSNLELIASFGRIWDKHTPGIKGALSQNFCKKMKSQKICFDQ